jgi:adenylate cyclase
LGDAEARALLRTHDRIVREWLGRHGGTEIKHTGDGFLAKFISAVGAIECAINMQRAFAAHTARHPNRPISVRMGLNAGEPMAEEGDLFGSTVNAAARICEHAEGGQILVAEVVQHLCAGKSLGFVDRGRIMLRGFGRRRFRVFEVPW